MYGFNGNEIILLLTHDKLLTFCLINIGSHEPQRKHLWKYICILKPENRLFVEFNDLKSSICSNPCVCTPHMFEIVGVWSFDQYISQFTWKIIFVITIVIIQTHNQFFYTKSFCYNNFLSFEKILHCPMNPTMYWSNMQ